MKKFTHFAASVALAIFVLQQAVSGMACTPTHRAICAVDCPMAAGMGADCVMASQMASSACPPNCCAHAVPQAMASLAALQKLHNVVLTAAVTLPVVLPMDRAETLSTLVERPTASPPLYILNQVFRI